MTIPQQISFWLFLGIFAWILALSFDAKSESLKECEKHTVLEEPCQKALTKKLENDILKEMKKAIDKKLKDLEAGKE